MLWKKISDYAIESGQWRISKAYLDGCTMYALHKDGEVIRYSEDADELKSEATKNEHV